MPESLNINVEVVSAAKPLRAAAAWLNDSQNIPMTVECAPLPEEANSTPKARLRVSAQSRDLTEGTKITNTIQHALSISGYVPDSQPGPVLDQFVHID